MSNVVTGTVVTEQIFQLDFNEFLRAKGSFRALYQKVTPLDE
jgi:hypothetical protein